MKTIKFKIISTQRLHNEVLGNEWVANGRWYHQFKDQTTNEGPALGTYERAQFTGLLDKNGEEIYCGDLVRVLYSDWISKGKNDERTLEQYLLDISKVGEVVFAGNARWAVQFANSLGSIFPGDHGFIQVIGNIYENDNPELLK